MNPSKSVLPCRIFRSCNFTVTDLRIHKKEGTIKNDMYRRLKRSVNKRRTNSNATLIVKPIQSVTKTFHYINIRHATRDKYISKYAKIRNINDPSIDKLCIHIKETVYTQHDPSFEKESITKI